MGLLPEDEFDRLERAVATLDQRIRAEMLRVITLPDHERAREIGELYQEHQTRAWAEVLMDLEESEFARVAVKDALRFARGRGQPAPT
jgi:hypothetical protein